MEKTLEKMRLTSTGKNEFTSIEEFVVYCENNAQKIGALFNKDEVSLMLQLAGSPKNWSRPQEYVTGNTKSYSLREEMGDLVALYRLINNQLKQATSYKDLYKVAMMIIWAGHEPLSMVFGINTGAMYPQENITILQGHVRQLHRAEENMFDQTQFHEHMIRIRNKEVDYEYNLHYDFYLPILEEGHIKKIFFTQDWTSSKEARWIHNQALRLSIKTYYQ